LSLQDVAPVPLLDGDELIAAGFSAGPAFRRILDSVYDAQLEGRISTKEEAIAFARTL
jgi:poly(A) polymerase